LDICKYSTRNIYQVAQDIDRPYSRVYGDVKKLQAIGLIKASSSKQAGRRVTLLSVA
jgi:predicted transcriptional regulator